MTGNVFWMCNGLGHIALHQCHISLQYYTFTIAMLHSTHVLLLFKSCQPC